MFTNYLYSLTDGNVRKIVTTDWTLGKNKKRTGGCTESHTGTSAATPLAAGKYRVQSQLLHHQNKNKGNNSKDLISTRVLL